MSGSGLWAFIPSHFCCDSARDRETRRAGKSALDRVVRLTAISCISLCNAAGSPATESRFSKNFRKQVLFLTNWTFKEGGQLTEYSVV